MPASGLHLPIALKAIMSPLVFDPRYWNRLWGGRSLQTRFGRQIPDGLVGESWEISTHSLHLSRVAEGPFVGRSLAELWQSHRVELSGTSHLPPNAPFPLLVKLLDCQQPLSVQVHPNAEQAAKLCPHERGKSEAWVVLDTGPNARLLAGFKHGVTRDDLLAALREGRVDACLHELRPQVGDCILIPAGVPHAIVGPLVLLEVQPTSDATFRLFDWNRVDLNGQPRTLHINESLAAIDWQCGPIDPVNSMTYSGTGSTRLLNSAEFALDRFVGKGVLDITYPSLAVCLLVSGRATLQDRSGYRRSFVPGETVLIPAQHSNCQWELHDDSELITALPPIRESN